MFRDGEGLVVLAKMVETVKDLSFTTGFVTHRIDAEGERYFGHYFTPTNDSPEEMVRALEDAIKDFKKRARIT